MTDKTWVYTCLSELMEAARAHQPPHLRDQTLEACRKALIEYNAERAVVEAAVCLATALEHADGGYGFCLQEVSDVCEAVEALQKERE